MTVMHKPIVSNPPRQKSAEQLALDGAKRLPTPVPGQVVTVKLKYLPAYLKLHGIEPRKYRNSVLLVRKVEESSESESTESAEQYE